jgi:P27 family predicted phage terminase small subunit
MNRDMSSSNLIKKADGNAFGRYCAYMAEWVELDRKLREMGEVIYETDTRHGKMQRIHPLFNARDRTESNLIKLEEQLGLTPRARIAILAHLSGQQPSLPGLGDEPAIAAQRDEDDSIGFLAGAHRPN